MILVQRCSFTDGDLPRIEIHSGSCWRGEFDLKGQDAPLVRIFQAISSHVDLTYHSPLLSAPTSWNHFSAGRYTCRTSRQHNTAQHYTTHHNIMLEKRQETRDKRQDKTRRDNTAQDMTRQETIQTRYLPREVQGAAKELPVITHMRLSRCFCTYSLTTLVTSI